VAIAESVSKVLGIKATGPLLLSSAVEKGLPLSSLDRVVRFVAPADNKFAYHIVPRATLARRRRAWANFCDQKTVAGQKAYKGRKWTPSAEHQAAGRLSAEEGMRLARLASFWAMAVNVWGDTETARQFMFEPHPLLHGRRPIDVVLENELGRPIVEGILGRLQHGSAV
jgi:putative toxin-antitoxin system antitoxin component (TIGR02293 family)